MKKFEVGKRYNAYSSKMIKTPEKVGGFANVKMHNSMKTNFYELYKNAVYLSFILRNCPYFSGNPLFVLSIPQTAEAVNFFSI